jgi:hypothetical protein
MKGYVFTKGWIIFIFFGPAYFGMFYLVHFKLKWRFVNNYRGTRWRAAWTLGTSEAKSDPKFFLNEHTDIL